MWTPHGCVLALSCVLLIVLTSSLADQSKEAVHDDPFVVYPFRLTSTSPFGRISDSALPGSEVPVDTTLPHFDFNERTRFLKLELFLNGPSLNVSGDGNNSSSFVSNSKQSKQHFFSKLPAYIQRNFLLPALPKGVRIDISGEEGNIARVDEKMAFTLDENLYIIVGNSDKFTSVDGIEFWVVAIQQRQGQPDKIVSNPVSFVVKIDHEVPVGQGAAVYAGIVVLVICSFALLIPLTVRTKRRLRQGKPLCACGSSSKKLAQQADQAETGTARGRATETKTSSSTDTGERVSADCELAVIFNSRPRTVSQLGLGPKTIQSQNLRMVSSHHFQPRWLDPHYKETYERPMFKALTPVPSGTFPTLSVHHSFESLQSATLGPVEDKHVRL